MILQLFIINICTFKTIEGIIIKLLPVSSLLLIGSLALIWSKKISKSICSLLQNLLVKWWFFQYIPAIKYLFTFKVVLGEHCNISIASIFADRFSAHLFHLIFPVLFFITLVLFHFFSSGLKHNIIYILTQLVSLRVFHLNSWPENTLQNLINK